MMTVVAVNVVYAQNELDDLWPLPSIFRPCLLLKDGFDQAARKIRIIFTFEAAFQSGDNPVTNLDVDFEVLAMAGSEIERGHFKVSKEAINKHVIVLYSRDTSTLDTPDASHDFELSVSGEMSETLKLGTLEFRVKTGGELYIGGKVEGKHLDGKTFWYNTFKTVSIPAIPPIPRKFSLPLAKWLNMICLPLKPDYEPTLANFVKAHNLEGEWDFIVIWDRTEKRFKMFFPDDLQEDYMLQGPEGFIIQMKSAQEITFEGTAWPPQIELRDGINLTGFPRKERFTKLLSEDNIAFPQWLVKLDPQKQEFEAVGYSDSVEGGQAYIIILTAARTISLDGEVWDNDDCEPCAGAPAYHHQDSKLWDAGSLINWLNQFSQPSSIGKLPTTWGKIKIK